MEELIESGILAEKFAQEHFALLMFNDYKVLDELHTYMVTEANKFVDAFDLRDLLTFDLHCEFIELYIERYIEPHFMHILEQHVRKLAGLRCYSHDRCARNS